MHSHMKFQFTCISTVMNLCIVKRANIYIALICLFLFYCWFTKPNKPHYTTSGYDSFNQVNASASKLIVRHVDTYTSINNTTKDTGAEEYTILLWTRSYHKGGSWFGEGSDPFSKCEYSNCMTTTDRARLNTSQALLFHMDFVTYDKLPPLYYSQRSHQKWILYGMECPERSNFYMEGHYLRNKTFNDIFNTTMNYHHNADIQYTYSHMYGRRFVQKPQLDQKLLGKNWAADKSKLIAWFVSDCGKWRGKYVGKLQQFVQVDIYGKCGPLDCKKKSPFANINDPCNQMLATDYKFYLSFESFLCEDYFTEKLWRALLFNTVPVVMGANDYSKTLPPNSYIDVKDFRSAEHLAEFLIMLDKNDSLYNSYMSWRGEYELMPYPAMQCQVCEYLNKNKVKVTEHRDMEYFWDNDRDCMSAEQYYVQVEPDTWR